MTNQKAICLISDGLDSPIATFLLEQKGVEVIGINFNNQPLVVPAKRKNKMEVQSSNKPIFDIAQTLVNSFKKQKKFELYIVPNGIDLQTIMTKSEDSKITCILCKRLMIKKAEQFAIELNARLIATGEILGEQASQTISNLKNIESALTTRILIRPNIGLNKDEIITIAREIGTYQHSEVSAKYTCGAVPIKPATQAAIERIISAEQKIGLEDSIKRSILDAEKHVFTKLDKKCRNSHT